LTDELTGGGLDDFVGTTQSIRTFLDRKAVLCGGSGHRVLAQSQGSDGEPVDIGDRALAESKGGNTFAT